MEKQNFNIEISPGVTEVTIREGKAQEIDYPVPLSFDGTFRSVLEYWKHRKSFIEATSTLHIITENSQPFLGTLTNESRAVLNEVHLKYNKTDLKIELVIGERDKYKDCIRGAIKINPELDAFGINREKYYTVDDFAKFIRTRQHLFADRTAYQILYANLNKSSVKIHTELENEKNDRGNKKANFNREVVSDLPKSFRLLTNPLKGYMSVSFDVEIGLEYIEGGVKIWLISNELIDREKELIDEAFKEVFEAFEGKIPLMEY